MKNFKKINFRKKGQALVEYVLIAALIGLVAGYTFLKLNPNFFKSYVKGSVTKGSTVYSNGQMTIQAMGD